MISTVHIKDMEVKRILDGLIKSINAGNRTLGIPHTHHVLDYETKRVLDSVIRCWKANTPKKILSTLTVIDPEVKRVLDSIIEKISSN